MNNNELQFEIWFDGLKGEHMKVASFMFRYDAECYMADRNVDDRRRYHLKDRNAIKSMD